MTLQVTFNLFKQQTLSQFFSKYLMKPMNSATVAELYNDINEYLRNYSIQINEEIDRINYIIRNYEGALTIKANNIHTIKLIELAFLPEIQKTNEFEFVESL